MNTLKSFRGNKFSREFIFVNDILKNSAETYFRKWLFLKFSREQIIQDISREQIFPNFANGVFFENFVGIKFREFSLFRENKFPRKFVPVKISHHENM